MAIPWHQSAPRHELKDRPSDLASNGAGQSSRGIEPGRLLFPVPSPAVAFRSPFSSSPALPPPRLQIILQRQPGRATATVMAPKRTATMRNRCQPARTQGPGESARSRSPRVCPYNSRYRRWRGTAPFHRHTASSPARGRGCLVALPARPPLSPHLRRGCLQGSSLSLVGCTVEARTGSCETGAVAGSSSMHASASSMKCLTIQKYW